MLATRSSMLYHLIHEIAQLTLPSSVFTYCITPITVGEDRVVFKIHEGLLRKASPVFDKALSSGFRESHDKKIELPEEDINTFNFFVQWLYHHHELRENLMDSFVPEGKAKREYFDKIIDLYCFAGKYEIEQLKRNVIGNLHYRAQTSGKSPSFTLTHLKTI